MFRESFWCFLGPRCLVPSPHSSSSWLLPSCRLLGRFAGVKKRAHLFEPFLSFSDGERMEKGKKGIHLSTKRDHRGKDDPQVRKGNGTFFSS